MLYPACTAINRKADIWTGVRWMRVVKARWPRTMTAFQVLCYTRWSLAATYMVRYIFPKFFMAGKRDHPVVAHKIFRRSLVNGRQFDVSEPLLGERRLYSLLFDIRGWPCPLCKKPSECIHIHIVFLRAENSHGIKRLQIITLAESKANRRRWAMIGIDMTD